jgi:hypothetical protein
MDATIARPCIRLSYSTHTPKIEIKEKYTFHPKKVAVRATEAGRQRPPGSFSPLFLPYLHFLPANNTGRPKITA